MEIKTQKELDKAIKIGITEFEFNKNGIFEIRSSPDNWIKVTAKVGVSVVARESSRVVARENSRVVAWGSSHVEAWENSHVEAWENSRVVARENSRVVAWENSRVEAWGFVSVQLFSKIKMKASAKVSVYLRNKDSKSDGGIKIDAILTTTQDWLEYYGVEVKRGVAILYKAVKDNYSSNWDNDFKYLPNTKPEAVEIDNEECSLGLHFCPTPSMAKSFHPDSTRYIACPVKVSEIMVNFDWSHPEKCKAKRVYKPCYEVNIDGERI